VYATSVWPIGQELAEKATEVVDVVAGVTADVLELEAGPGISTTAQSHSQLTRPFLSTNLAGNLL
jgi:hypothetical protein